ncbi:MAG: tetratricopeptide repeat protein [Cyanobacteria bacterium P01_D01_bin.56]
MPNVCYEAADLIHQHFCKRSNLDGYLAFFDKQHENYQKLSKIEKTSPEISREPIKFGVHWPRNRYFSGRVAVLEQLHKQLSEQRAVAINQIQAISGLGGIGKTQTAVEYAFRHHFDEPTYEYVFWVVADIEANLSLRFAELADQLALPTGKGTLDEKILAVEAWLAKHSNWLLIFDNADNPTFLKPWIPNNPEGKILITSRASVFLDIDIASPLALEPLSTEEGTEMLFKRTEYAPTDAERAAAAELTLELGGLPLALEQASAYMRRQRMSIDEYLRFYRKQGLSLLRKAKAPPKNYKHHESPVFKTWQINFDAVRDESLESSELLEFSSFLAPDDIPYRILINGSPNLGGNLLKAFEDKDEEDSLFVLKELLEPLSQYSLVEWVYNRPYYSMHRLVQAVVRDRLEPVAVAALTEQSIATVELAYPGEELQNWSLHAELIPHWLNVIDRAHEIEFQSKSLGIVLNQAAFFFDEQGRYNEAEQLYQESLRFRKQMFGDESLEVTLIFNNLAAMYDKQGRLSESEELYKEALRIRKHLLGDEHTDVAVSCNNLATLYDKQKKYAEAELLHRETLALRRRLLGNEHLDVANSLNNLAQACANQGKHVEAEVLYSEALTICKKLMGDDSPYVALCLNNLAISYDHQQRFDEAVSYSRQSLEMHERLLGDTHPAVAICYSNLAKLLANQGNYDESLQNFNHSLELCETNLGLDHPISKRVQGRLEALYKKINASNT